MGRFEKKKSVKSVHRDYKADLNKKEPKGYTVFLTKLNKPVVLWSCVFVLLFFYLQKQLAFHFYYIEQEQIFLWSSTYFSSFVAKPAGLVQWLTEFCIQYFIKPYFGALITSALLTTIGVFTAEIIKRVAHTANLSVLGLLPIVFLLYMHFDLNYSYKGTVAYLLMLLVMYGYFYTTHFIVRVSYVTVFGTLLFWLAGPVAFLFTGCVLLWEIANRFSKAYIFILPILLIIVLAFWGVHASLVGDYRFLILPDGYYGYRLHPDKVIYLSWISLPVILLFCRLLRDRKPVEMKQRYVESLLQLLFVIALFWFGIDKFTDRSYDKYKELNYYVNTEQWNKIIEQSRGEISNYLYLSLLNMALVEKGELAENMFSFDQRGVQGLNVQWNQMPHISALQSNIYFSIGYIAYAQRMAFEANASMKNSNVAMLKRLVQTNLIYGAYPIAEKYIDLLMQTKYYKEWAREHRRFLWNDDAVEKDLLLGIKRKCIPESNSLVDLQRLHIDLEYIAEQNPAHKASFQFVGAMYLLSKEVALFKELLEKYYGTAVLPTLPKSYQEAVIIMAEHDPSYWEQFNVSASIIQRYNEFRRQVLANRGNAAALPGLLKASFGDTYWYYYMFMNRTE